MPARLTNPNIVLRESDNFLVNREGVEYKTNADVLKQYVNNPDKIADPFSDHWLHIKNVRGGRLKIKFNSSKVDSIQCLGVGTNIPWARDDGELRYGRAVELFWHEDGDWLPFGDATRYERQQKQNEGDGKETLIEWGYNPSNWFGYEIAEEDQEYVWLHPMAETERGTEVPNNYEYLVYLHPGSDERVLEPEEGCTYEIGPLTYTAKRKSWRGFFKQAPYVPDLKYLDTSGSESFFEMFYQANIGEHPSLRFLKTGNGKDFTRMFSQTEVNADVSSWDMTNAETCHQMFNQCRNFDCNRRKSAGRGLDKWRMPKISSKQGIDYMFYQCDNLLKDIHNWELPLLTELPNQFEQDSPIKLSCGEVTLKTGSNYLGRPWEGSVNGRDVYFNANRFVQDPVLGPDRFDPDDSKTVVNYGYSKEFDLERKELWKSYYEWIDARVAAGDQSHWSANTQDVKDKITETRAKDDELIEKYAEPEAGV